MLRWSMANGEVERNPVNWSIKFFCVSDVVRDGDEKAVAVIIEAEAEAGIFFNANNLHYHLFDYL